MRGRRVDDAGARVVDQLDAFPRGIVGQAQDDEGGVVQRLTPCLRVLALGVVERDQRDLVAPVQPFANLQSGRAGRAVDEDAVLQGNLLRVMIVPISAMLRRTT